MVEVMYILVASLLTAAPAVILSLAKFVWAFRRRS